MPWLAQYRALAEYNRWMNRKLVAVGLELTDEEQTRDLGAFFGSVLATLNHLLLVDLTWMRRITNDRERFDYTDASGRRVVLTSNNQILYPDFAAFRDRRDALDDQIVEWAQSLDEATLERPFRWRTTAGETHEHPLWWTVSHFFNHQTHHRGQVTTLLKQLGRDPGVTDLGIFLVEARGI
jgi:uncharacterized damage-inducible protein DinB